MNATPINQTRSPPPIPKRSSKRYNAKESIQPISTKPKTPMKTFRYSAGYMDALESPVTPTQTDPAGVENPFSDAFATRVSEDTEPTRYGSVFDTQSHEVPTPTSAITADGEIDKNRVSLLENIPNNAEVAFVGLPTPNGDNEPFPSFTHRLEQMNGEPSLEQVEKQAKGLVGKIGGFFKKLQNLDEDLESWETKQERKYLIKKQEAKRRRDSNARAKAIDDQHRAQIKEHREREKARNKRAKAQLKLHTKCMKQSARKRYLAVNGKNVPKQDDGRLIRFWDRLRYRPVLDDADQTTCEVDQEGGISQESTAHRGGYQRLADTSSSGGKPTKEVPGVRAKGERPTRGSGQGNWENWDDYVFLRGADEYDPGQCGPLRRAQRL